MPPPHRPFPLPHGIGVGRQLPPHSGSTCWAPQGYTLRCQGFSSRAVPWCWGPRRKGSPSPWLCHPAHRSRLGLGRAQPEAACPYWVILSCTHWSVSPTTAHLEGEEKAVERGTACAGGQRTQEHPADLTRPGPPSDRHLPSTGATQGSRWCHMGGCTREIPGQGPAGPLPSLHPGSPSCSPPLFR